MFGRFRQLRDQGILGINKRNADYIFGHNPRRLFPLVDDKLNTKDLCRSCGLRTPALYGTIAAHGQVQDLGKLLEPLDSFVIKPASGAMGNGVLVVTSREGDHFVRTSGARLDLKDLRYHVSSILSGLYSLGGRADRAIIEARVQTHPVFDELAQGVPDCRVIVFRGVPVMAMLRLPTRMSDGRANLHQGAVAAGVDIRTGITHRAVHLDRVVKTHPDSGRPLAGIHLPFWDEILLISAKCADMTGLGYLGADVVIDAEDGPTLLELNGRPGLSIQIANGAGLLPLLRRVEEMGPEGASAEDRIEMARCLSGPKTGRERSMHRAG